MSTELNNVTDVKGKTRLGQWLADWLAALFLTLTEPVYLQALPPKDVRVTSENKPVDLVITRQMLINNPALIEHIHGLNKTRGVYFRPNTGGIKDEFIVGFNAFFAEYDDLSIDEQLRRFKNAPVPPSILVVTKKSVHAYWLIDGDCSEAEWRDIQARLIAYFGSDGTIKNPSRLMRLPGFNHVSVNEEGKFEYKLVECVLFEPSQRYTAEVMRKAFPPAPSRKTTVVQRYDQPAREGERNSLLYRRGCYYRDLGWEEDQIVLALMADNKKLCIPELLQTEIKDLARNVCRYAKGSGFHTTELGNAKRLIARHGHNLRYCKKLKCWLIWNGKYWQEDETGEVERMAKETSLSIYLEAGTEKDGARREDLARWAMRSESEKVLQSTISLARSEPGVAITPKDLDRNRMLLNTESGTLDLSTGELYEHRREDLITRIIPTGYDPDAVCPQFDVFLWRVMNGNKDLIRFLKRLTGYALTGRMDEQMMAIFHGEGANGKTTLIEILIEMFGDYAVRTAPETFMVKPFGGMPNDLPRLKGARVVTATEGEEGQRLAESFIKQVTGGDTITARKLYCEPCQRKSKS